jgi:hypothetical protein
MDGSEAGGIVIGTDFAEIFTKFKNEIDKHFENTLCNVMAMTLLLADHDICKHVDIQGDGWGVRREHQYHPHCRL